MANRPLPNRMVAISGNNRGTIGQQYNAIVDIYGKVPSGFQDLLSQSSFSVIAMV